VTNDEIIRMASDAGFSQEDDDIFVCAIEHIQKLLEIEREASAKLCQESDRYRGDYFASIIKRKQ
jgi:hypothetical protein